MNFLRKFIGTQTTDEVASIPSGKLFLTRSKNSPKGAIECLYNDAYASIKQTNTPFLYQLCITKVYQEGELEFRSPGFDGEDDDEYDDDDEEYAEANSLSGGRRNGTSATTANAAGGGIGGVHRSTSSLLLPGGNYDSRHNSKDEWVFPLDEELKIFKYHKLEVVDSKTGSDLGGRGRGVTGSGSWAIAWNDLNGDLGDKFEFVIDEDVRLADFESFMTTVYKCLYEAKYRESSIRINDMAQLREFVYDPKLELLNFDDLDDDDDDDDDDDEEEDQEELEYYSDQDEEVAPTTTKQNRDIKSGNKEKKQHLFVPLDEISDNDSSEDQDNSETEPKGTTVYSTKKFTLHWFDSTTGSFLLKSTSPTLKLIDLSKWEFTMYINGQNGITINKTLSKNMSPTFNYEHLSFIFNHYTITKDDVIANSWLLKFNDFNELTKFQNKFLALMYETLNKRKFGDESEENYFVDAFSNLDVNDEDKDEVENLAREEEEEEEDDDDDNNNHHRKQNEEEDDYSSEDDDDNEPEVKHREKETSEEFQNFRRKDKNTYLTVGYKDRAFVARGDKIGVFGQDDRELNYKTTINNVTDTKGRRFDPLKMLLHQQDQFMIMSNPEFNDKSLYKMDLNRGKIVEEWKVSENVPVKSYAPTSKFAQLTDQQILTGISLNGLFTIDPRLAGTKLVNDRTYKSYKTTNNQFQTLATTESGHIALGSGKGDIRLFDRLGVNAKTALPSLGDSIIGIDVSKDGRWILATCKTYLLLIDTKIGSGQKNAGKYGFTAYFDKDKKPTPRRLALQPEHEAFIIQQNRNQELKFSPAYFNTGLDKKETSIVTSTDNYIITWSLSKILKNQKDPYQVKRYNQNVISDNFKFGTNNEVITALQDDVSMTNRRSLANPNKVFTSK
ncbi:conserved hypothetical protein [Lodderomyces elongisporus NRRL YB-4239]|uniref:Vacuolar import and degradation protein 27 n=1 Tax=Lodderomyces elongisporus (strain ATCC 11503 / CBS 2605 / JCM 1781 / NBRC 1676 / NRRL YB-4239) TaxID=379508 RepID=A5E4X6_LODEL|nr:conserved hypothetical protein [Lodderomyces elongisporus NRRL YB-4239]